MEAAATARLEAEITHATSQDLPRVRRTSLRPRAPSTTVSVSTTSASRSNSISSSSYAPISLAGPYKTPQMQPRREVQEPGSPVHPFANTTAKLELIPSSSGDGIDIAEEAQLYDELCRSYEEETDAFDPSITPTRQKSNATPLDHASKLTKPRPKGPPRPMSLPPESLFSADIFLADNTSPLYHTPLFAQDIRISGWTTVGDGAGKPGKGVGAYVAYDCAIVTREGTTMHILKRYSAFEELHDKLKKTLPRPLLPSLPSLPPKAPLARFRPAFLDSRRKLLQFWLTSVLLHPEIGGREVVRDWVLS